MISRIYPNPTSGKLNFEIIADSRKTLTIEAFDLLGKKVGSYILTVEQGISENPVLVNALSAGTYFIQVKIKEGFKTLSVVKE